MGEAERDWNKFRREVLEHTDIIKDTDLADMYKDKPFGLYKFGYIEDLESINSKNLYQYYNPENILFLLQHT